MREQISSELREYRSFLSELGKRFDLVQGLGGNASLKSGPKMAVKASGKRLGSARDKDYFYSVIISEGKFFDVVPSQQGKPSIETFLHAALPHKYVVHLHSTAGVAVSMLAEKNSACAELLAGSGVKIVPYSRPGQALHREIAQTCFDSDATCLLLQNHGTLFFADSISSLETKINLFEQLASDITRLRLRNLVWPESPQSQIAPSQKMKAVWHALLNWRISPDHCVFLGALPSFRTIWALVSSKTSGELLAFRAKKLAAGNLEGEQLAWFFNVAQCLPLKKLSTLSLREGLYLVRWDLEQYRRNRGVES